MALDRGDGLPQPGDTFAGKYAILRAIGQGGAGVVFEAEHLRLQQRVAIKILRSEVRHSAEWLARFDREARAAVALHGANVARTLDVDSLADGTPYIVMEMLHGRDLAHEMSERGPLPVAEAVGYILEACAAMAEAHALGIVHRDLTPRNLFLAVQGDRRMVKVLDFGISKIEGEQSDVTATNAAFGTPNYVSPEQIRASSQVDSRTDIWSLAVILFEMLAGRPPFQGTSASAVVAAVVTERPQALRELRPELPKRLVAAVMRALEKNADERFQRIEDFATAIAGFAAPLPFTSGEGLGSLEAFVTVNGVVGRPSTTWAPPPRRSRQRLLWIAIALLAVAFMVPAVQWGLLQHDDVDGPAVQRASAAPAAPHLEPPRAGRVAAPASSTATVAPSAPARSHAAAPARAPTASAQPARGPTPPPKPTVPPAATNPLLL